MPGIRSERFKAPTPLPVGFVGPHARVTGEVVDISLTGTLICCSTALKPGTLGRFGLEVGHETFRALAVVRRRVKGGGVAFPFLGMTQYDRHLLHGLLFRLSHYDSKAKQ